MHQSADLLVIHPDPDMKEPHVDPYDSFGIAPEVIGFAYQTVIKRILFIFAAA